MPKVIAPGVLLVVAVASVKLGLAGKNVEGTVLGAVAAIGSDEDTVESVHLVVVRESEITVELVEVTMDASVAGAEFWNTPGMAEATWEWSEVGHETEGHPLTVTIKVHEDTEFLGISDGTQRGFGVVQFGGIERDSSFFGINWEPWKWVSGGPDVELQVKVDRCDRLDVEVWQQLGGDVASIWEGLLPQRPYRRSAEGFKVLVRYDLMHNWSSHGVLQSGCEQRILEEMVWFDFESAELSNRARRKLSRKVGILQNNPGTRLWVAGHADDRGEPAYNRDLGMQRATEVLEYLVANGTSSNQLLKPVSYGECMPLPGRPDEDPWTRNRRVEFQVMDEAPTEGDEGGYRC